MYDEYFNRIQSVSEVEAQEISLWLTFSIEIETREEIFNKLKILLANKTPNELFQLRNSYTRWMGICGWDLFYSLTADDMENIVSNYTFTGLLVGENVWEKIITYLHNRFLENESMEEAYTKLRESFLHSEEVLYSVDSSTLYTIEKFVADSNAPRVVSDSLSESEFLSRVQGKIKQRINEGKYEIDPFRTLGRLRDLSNFFVGIKQDRIWYIVDPYFYPQQYNLDARTQEKGVLNFTEDLVANDEELLNSIATNNTKNTKKVEIKTTYKDIFNEIQKSITSVGESEKDEHIIFQLDELAKKYTDERIKDLYYFDEEAAEFTWNDELLNEE